MHHPKYLQDSLELHVDVNTDWILPYVRSQIDLLIRVYLYNFCQNLLSSVLSRVDVTIEFCPVDNPAIDSVWIAIVLVVAVIVLKHLVFSELHKASLCLL